MHEYYQKGPLYLLTHLGLADNLAKCDLQEISNPQYVADVAATCTDHLHKTQDRFQPSESCTCSAN